MYANYLKAILGDILYFILKFKKINSKIEEKKK